MHCWAMRKSLCKIYHWAKWSNFTKRRCMRCLHLVGEECIRVQAYPTSLKLIEDWSQSNSEESCLKPSLTGMRQSWTIDVCLATKRVKVRPRIRILIVETLRFQSSALQQVVMSPTTVKKARPRCSIPREIYWTQLMMTNKQSTP